MLRRRGAVVLMAADPTAVPGAESLLLGHDFARLVLSQCEQCRLAPGAPSSSRPRRSRPSGRSCRTWSRTSSPRCGPQTPAYGEVLAGPEGMAIRVGIEQAHRAFLAALERGERPAGDTDELWRAPRGGRVPVRARPGRAARGLPRRHPRRLAGRRRHGAEAGVSAPLAIATAEAIFVYADELAADVVEGTCGSSPTRPASASAAAAASPRCCLTPTATTPRRSRAPPISPAGRSRARWP